MKFMGEAYNYKLLHTDNLFFLLYKLINYDINIRKQDEYFAQLDSDKIDSFRIRLVCTLLDSLGAYFWKGERRTQMDRFLIFFQRYIFSKKYVLMDLEFMILDSFDKMRPSHSYKKYSHFQQVDDVCRQIEKFEKANFKQGYIVPKNKSNAKLVGTSYLMTEKDKAKYDDLIDSLAYEEEPVQPSKPIKKDRKQQNDSQKDEAKEGHDIYKPKKPDQQDLFVESPDGEVKISKKDIELMKTQIKEQQMLIEQELEKKEVQDFADQLNKLMQEETMQARKDPANAIKKKFQPFVMPINEIKKKIPIMIRNPNEDQPNKNEQVKILESPALSVPKILNKP